MVQIQSSKYQKSKQEKDTFTANLEMLRTLEAEKIEPCYYIKNHNIIYQQIWLKISRIVCDENDRKNLEREELWNVLGTQRCDQIKIETLTIRVYEK
ncbi:22222_t:CDS:2 [Gigaspora margarita]|uniref:22222_t:CDS:1 n=1 Tax=Gigaspora margarita TaxID=4874 RepID=A0ABN7UI06_GIGMA|nr:22222_t:CDS:2 [Gigaspora margarita]